MRTENEGADGLVPIGRHRARRAWRRPRRLRHGRTDRARRCPELRPVGLRPSRSSAGVASAARSSCATRSVSRTGSPLEDPDGQVLVRAHAEESEIGHRTLLERRGFGPVRHFFLMRRPSLDDVPDVPLPDGLAFRTVRPEEHRAIWDAEDEAFRDHWGAHAHTEHEFQVTFGRVRTGYGPVGGRLGRRSRSPASSRPGSGPKRTSDSASSAAGSRRSASRRPWRKRGLGRAMTAAALGQAPGRRHGRCDARGGLGEPDRCARPVRTARVRGLPALDRVRSASSIRR